MRRFTLRTSLALVALAALGMAAMRIASLLLVQAAFTAMVAALAVGLLGAIVRRGEPAWAGFALFGGIYAFLVFAPTYDAIFGPQLLTHDPLEWAVERIRAIPPDPGSPPVEGVAYEILAQYPGAILDSKVVNGRQVRLSGEEAARVKAYQALYVNRSTALNDQGPINRTRQIGKCALTLIAGLLGALVAQVLVALPRRAPGTTRLDTLCAASPPPEDSPR